VHGEILSGTSTGTSSGVSSGVLSGTSTEVSFGVSTGVGVVVQLFVPAHVPPHPFEQVEPAQVLDAQVQFETQQLKILFVSLIQVPSGQ